jgi:hypothetical protein
MIAHSGLRAADAHDQAIARFYELVHPQGGALSYMDIFWVLGTPHEVSRYRARDLEIQALAPDDTCCGDALVPIRWQGRTMAILLSQFNLLQYDVRA